MCDQPYNDYDVIWNGGPLLPNRPSRPDARWHEIPIGLGDPGDADSTTKPQKPSKTARIYTKKNRAYWDRLRVAQPLPPIPSVRGGSIDPLGEATAPGTGDPGYRAECLPATPHHSSDPTADVTRTP